MEPNLAMEFNLADLFEAVVDTVPDRTAIIAGDRRLTFRELDDDEWLTGEFEVQHSVGGLALEHGTIAAPGGVVLGESFHTRLTG